MWPFACAVPRQWQDSPQPPSPLFLSEDVDHTENNVRRQKRPGELRSWERKLVQISMASSKAGEDKRCRWIQGQSLQGKMYLLVTMTTEKKQIFQWLPVCLKVQAFRSITYCYWGTIFSFSYSVCGGRKSFLAYWQCLLSHRPASAETNQGKKKRSIAHLPISQTGI